MDIRPIAGALGLLYAATAQAGIAADVVTGERGTAVGVAAVIGAVATAAGVLLWRSSQAASRTVAEALDMVRLERAEHANTRARLDRTDRKLDQTEHKLGLTELKLHVAEVKLDQTEHKLHVAEVELVRLRLQVEGLHDNG